MVRNTVLLVEPRILENLPVVIEEFHSYLNDWNYVFYCGKNTAAYWKDKVGSYVELRELDVTNFASADEYSWYMKQAELWASLEGEFVLSIQADTWIMSIAPYTIDYFLNLNKSYIGGNMSYIWAEMLINSMYSKCNITHVKQNNFNGGLSLRKINDMVKIIDTIGVKKTIDSEEVSLNLQEYAEDVYFTLGCYKLELPIGDNADCQYFALNSVYKDKFFGVHNPSEKILNNSNILNEHFSKKTSMFGKRNPYISYTNKVVY